MSRFVPFSPHSISREESYRTFFWTFWCSSQLTVDLEIQKLNIWVNFIYMTSKIQQNIQSTRISDPTETVIPHPTVYPDSGKNNAKLWCMSIFIFSKIKNWHWWLVMRNISLISCRIHVEESFISWIGCKYLYIPQARTY